MTPNVLLSSAGRRVALLESFRDSLEELGQGGVVVAADASPLSAAFHAADRAVRVPRCTIDEFVPAMLKVCRTHEIRLVVPTIDTELGVLAASRDLFAEAGVVVAVSDAATIGIGADKQRTHDWLTEHGFPTVRQVSAGSGGGIGDCFPLIVKPRRGSASVGVTRVDTPEELARASSTSDVVVQEVAPGDEYTIDVFVDRGGRAVCAVPRRRLEVRGGEVSKSLTVRSALLEDLACSLAETLPGAYGALNIQVFLDEVECQPRVIEINPRFGGGFPLAWQAGAPFPRWLIEDAADLPSSVSRVAWRDNLVMLRYDDALFVDGRDVERESVR